MTRKEVMCHQCIEQVYCVDYCRILMYNSYTDFPKGGIDAR